MELIPGTKLRRAVVQSLNDERAHLVDIPDQRVSQWTLLALDMERKELTFYEYDYTTRRSSLTMLAFGSERQGDSIVVQGVDAQFTTLLRVGSGWVAWDATREPGHRYRVAWSLANGRGAHKAFWGRSITAVTVDPDGAYVAISETTALRDYHVQDAVYVLRTSDGKEVWRRNLPTYARSSLAFLGEKFFVYTDADGEHSRVRVLQIPD
jgi:outer membrane protein assembly factor BamB